MWYVACERNVLTASKYRMAIWVSNFAWAIKYIKFDKKRNRKRRGDIDAYASAFIKVPQAVYKKYSVSQGTNGYNMAWQILAAVFFVNIV